MDKYENIKQEFLSDDNLATIKHETGGTKVYLSKQANKYINDAVIRNNNFNLYSVNNSFNKWLKTRSNEPLANEIMTLDDSDAIDYDSLKYKRPWLRKNFEVNMFDLIAERRKRVVPNIYGEYNRYGSVDPLQLSTRGESESLLFKDYTEEYYANPSKIQSMLR